MRILFQREEDFALKEAIRNDETIEDLQLGGFKIIQKKTGFRFGMDAVLLADFAAIHKKDYVADFGTGTGILPLLLIGRDKGMEFSAFEIQKEYCDMAQRTMEMNRLEQRVHLYNQDACQAEHILGPCSVHAVICNPPYSRPGAAIASPYPERAAARNQSRETLSGFFTAAFRILKGKGKFFMIYPASQMLQAMRLMQECHLEPKRFQLIYPYPHKPANLILIEGVKDAKPTLEPMPPLIIYNENSLLTNKLKSIYHIEEQNSV